MTGSSRRKRPQDDYHLQRRKDTASKRPNPFQPKQDTRSPSRPTTYAVLAVCGCLLLAVWLLFGQTIHHGFVNFDDNEYVYENSHIVHGQIGEKIAWALTTGHAANWHPLTWLSHLLDYQLYGLDAGGHHATNVLLHAATAILLFLVLRRMTGDLWPSALVAAIFAIHPLRVESVAWVAERKDVLSGLFFVLTLWAYLGYVRRPFSLVRYLAVVVLFALGLMAKPMAVTLPLVLLLLDYWPLGRITPRPVLVVGGATTGRGFMNANGHLLVEKMPLLALSVASCVTTMLVQSHAVLSIDAMPLWARMSNGLVSYAAYLGQFFYPAGLAGYYPHPGADLPLWKPIAAITTLVIISGMVLKLRSPALLIGWFWYLGMLVPVIGFVQVGSQAMADRYTYLPQIGLCIALAWGIAPVFAAWPYRRWAYGVGSVLVLAILMACAWRQTTFWRDSMTLWKRALACTSRNAMAHNNLGYCFFDRGRLGEAIAEYRQNVEIMPNDATARNYLARALADNGQLDEAILQYRKVLEIKPESAEAANRLANALLDAGRLDEAVTYYRKAVTIKPDYADAYNNLAWLRATCPQASVRNGKEAVELAQEAIRRNEGKDPNFLATLAAAYAEAGRFSTAVETARTAMDLAVRQNKQSLANALKSRIRLFEAGKPFRQALPAPAAQRTTAPAK